MADLTGEILPQLRAHRLQGLDLKDDLLHPDYAGGSLLNLPATICRLLGVPEIGAPPLRPEILHPLVGDSTQGNFRQVILVVMDALSLHRMQRWMDSGPAAVWKQMSRQGVLAPITSITPSTTSAALTSLWTGRSAAEHGIVGYEMWMKEYGVVVNTISHAPITFRGEAGSLERAGFDPESYLPFPTLGEHLAAYGIPSAAFQHFSIVASGLSRMFFKGVATRAFTTSTDLWISLRKYLEAQAGQRGYAYVYWSEIDTFSHRFGPDDERAEAEFAGFSSAMERLFLDRLSAEAAGDTLLMLVADHGQITTRPDPHYELRNHPGLLRRLHILPTGENRLAYLFVRPGQMEAVREYLERTWPNQFLLLDSAYAVEAGLFGPGTPHPRLLDRLGDLIVVARGEAFLWWANKENRLVGRHGGLHPHEMLVPFLAARL